MMMMIYPNVESEQRLIIYMAIVIMIVISWCVLSAAVVMFPSDWSAHSTLHSLNPQKIWITIVMIIAVVIFFSKS